MIVGDLSDGSVEALGDSAKHLGDLKSKQGTYFVTGTKLDQIVFSFS